MVILNKLVVVVVLDDVILASVLSLRHRLDYQPLFGKMSPQSSKTEPGKRQKSSLPAPQTKLNLWGPWLCTSFLQWPIASKSTHEWPRIGHLHDGVILLLRPESFSFFLSYPSEVWITKALISTRKQNPWRILVVDVKLWPITTGDHEDLEWPRVTRHQNIFLTS